MSDDDLNFPHTEEELHASYWNNKAKQSLHTALNIQPNLHKAKNVILFLGDGMGVPTVTAARILKGQLAGHSGEETSLVMDTFPHLALSKTYNVDQQMPDSAGTATAYLCGVKANYGTLGVSAAAPLSNCSASFGNEVTSVLHRSKQAGKSVGIVTTTRVQHASPGASYAHTADRDWYSDAELTPEAVENGCRDIAYQLVHNTEINVILGGGRQYMFPTNVQDPEYPTTMGGRKDGRNLITEWLQNKKKAKYVWNKAEFDKVNPKNTDFLMGLFETKDCRYELDRDPTMDPSLSEMVEKAIKFCPRTPRDFFFLGRIDHAHHAGRAKRSLYEAIELDKAIGRAAELTNELDTLSVVTADHSHVFAFGGHSARGNSVLGVSRKIADDNKRFTMAVYGNGPGYQIGPNGTRPDVNATLSSDSDYRQQAPVPLGSETHGIEDVAIFAKGPMSHLFHGVQEQNYIAHVMAYASCIEPYDECKLPEPNYAPTVHSAVGKETEKNLRCLKLLLQNGVNPNVKSSDGLTPLHIAAVWGCYQNLKLLLNNGGDPNLTDTDGNTPRQLAEQQDNRKCAQLLRDYQTDSGETEEEDLPCFSYCMYSDQTDTSSYPDSEFSFSSHSSKISDFGEGPLSSTRRSSFFNLCNTDDRPNDRGLSHRFSDMGNQKRNSQEWNSWAFEGPSILSSTRMSTAGLVGTLPVVKEDDLWTDEDKISPLKRNVSSGLPMLNSRKSVTFRDVDEYFPVFSPEICKQPPIENISQSLPFDPTQYSDFLDTERMATVLQAQGIDVTSPDHVYVFSRESSESTDENLEKTVISQCALDESDVEEQQPGKVKAVQTEKLGSGSSSGTTSSHYSSCDSDHYTSAVEGPANIRPTPVTEELFVMNADKDTIEPKRDNKKQENTQIGQIYSQSGSQCKFVEHLSDSFDNLALIEAHSKNNDAPPFCNVSDEIKPVLGNCSANQFDQDLSFTPSPFVTGRTRSRLSRCSMRTSRTPESLLVTSALFEETLPTPVRSRRETPRSQSSEGQYIQHTASPTTYCSIGNSNGKSVPTDYQDTGSSTLRASSSLSSSQSDTNVSNTVSDTLSFVETQDDTFILDKDTEIMDAYEKNLAEIVKAIQNKTSSNFLTDDLTSTDDGKNYVHKVTCKMSERSPKEDEVWITEDCNSQLDSVSSSSSSSYFSPRRSREDSDLPCTPGTGCTPRYSMNRLSDWSRPRNLANISYTPGGRPVIDDVEEPVEYLYTDTEQGHKFIETHIPPTANTSLSSSTNSEETILYDWRSMHRDAVKSKEKENQDPKVVKQNSSSDSDVEVLPETRGLTDKELRRRLLELGESPGPISSRTRPTYMRRLCRLLQESTTQSPNPQNQSDLGYSRELCQVLRTFELPQCQEDEQALCQQFEQPDQNRKWREGIIKSSFNYLLLDPRITNNLPFRSHIITPHECFKTFVNAIFYVGKGKRSRPYSHLYEALEYYKGEKTSKKLCRKVDHILQVWNAGQGVISLHCFQNVIPVEAYTREACMVEAIGLKMLTNQKRGDYYGIVSTGSKKGKRSWASTFSTRPCRSFWLRARGSSDQQISGNEKRLFSSCTFQCKYE
ncbi:hypothetical protein WMY93_025366 [Mugilogobius chulae]|uniref:alkaline phosphatase n=1 Tax=Mugilogobius chulae TaxID=88201 RepID=A0AAW0NES9_9GOBI